MMKITEFNTHCKEKIYKYRNKLLIVSASQKMEIRTVAHRICISSFYLGLQNDNEIRHNINIYILAPTVLIFCDGILGSPVPKVLVAIIRNSYSIHGINSITWADSIFPSVSAGSKQKQNYFSKRKSYNKFKVLHGQFFSKNYTVVTNVPSRHSHKKSICYKGMFLTCNNFCCPKHKFLLDIAVKVHLPLRTNKALPYLQVISSLRQLTKWNNKNQPSDSKIYCIF